MATKQHTQGISISEEAFDLLRDYAEEHGVSISKAIDMQAHQLRTDFREGNWPDQLTPEQAAICEGLTHCVEGDVGGPILVPICLDAPAYRRIPLSGMWHIEDAWTETADTCGIVSAIAGPGVIATP